MSEATTVQPREDKYPYLTPVPIQEIQKSSELEETVESILSINRHDLLEVMFQAAIDQLKAAEELLQKSGGKSNSNILQKSLSARRLSKLASEINLEKVSFDSLDESRQADEKIIDELLQKNLIKQNDIDAIKHWCAKKTIKDAISESRYGVTRVDHFRTITYQRVEKGETGGLLVVDMAGLKTFNYLSHDHGDAALEKVSDFLKDFLGLYFMGDKSSFIGRKGDEFYVFVPGKNVQQVLTDFEDFSHKHQDRLYGSTGRYGYKKIDLYSAVVELSGTKGFDRKFSQGDEEVEQKKLKKIEEVIEDIRLKIDPNSQQLTIITKLANYINLAKEKRLPISIVRELLTSGIDLVKVIVPGLNEEQQNEIDEVSREIGELLQGEHWGVESFIVALQNYFNIKLNGKDS